MFAIPNSLAFIDESHYFQRERKDLLPTDNVTIVRIFPGLIFLLALSVVVVPFWRIFAKAGFSGWLSLFIVIPFINLIVLYYVAFSVWRPKESPATPE